MQESPICAAAASGPVKFLLRFKISPTWAAWLRKQVKGRKSVEGLMLNKKSKSGCRRGVGSV